MSARRTKHIAVREVTHPLHGARGEVVLRPGEQFAGNVELPEGTRWKWAVAEAPEVPAAEGATEPQPPAAEPGDGAAADDAPGPDGRPSVNAPKADWVNYAAGIGFDRGLAESMTKVDLLARFGPKADA